MAGLKRAFWPGDSEALRERQCSMTACSLGCDGEDAFDLPVDYEIRNCERVDRVCVLRRLSHQMIMAPGSMAQHELPKWVITLESTSFEGPRSHSRTESSPDFMFSSSSC